MEQLKMMKEQLTSCVQGQMSNMANADAEELGEAIDMIKDLAEAIYYCTVTEAMEGKDKEKEKTHETYYYTERMYPYYKEDYDRMYYPTYSDGGANSGHGTISYYTPQPSRMMARDYREGRSPEQRRYYMEMKEHNQDTAAKMQSLEKYMQELSKDVTEMIQDATPEEKQLLQQKIATLATKIK